uniref:Putative ovule protein n=1 Tax=Solanum chacoense TaxID=4108 RepID=A0A0V0HM35_SOLCH
MLVDYIGVKILLGKTIYCDCVQIRKKAINYLGNRVAGSRGLNTECILNLKRLELHMVLQISRI